MRPTAGVGLRGAVAEASVHQASPFGCVQRTTPPGTGSRVASSAIHWTNSSASVSRAYTSSIAAWTGGRRHGALPQTWWTRRVSLLDKAWHWRHTMGGVGIIIVDPVHTILERLSVRYLDSARAVGAAQVEPVLGHPVELSPAFFHPYKGNWFPDLDPQMSGLIPEFDRAAPFVGVGWVVHGVDEGDLLHEGATRADLPERGRELCRRLLDGEPRLCLCGGGRWAAATTTSTGSEFHLAALLAFNEENWPDRIPEPRPPGPPTALWDRARRAANLVDAADVRRTLAEGARRYSPAGRRALEIGVLNLLALRVADRQTDRVQGRDRTR